MLDELHNARAALEQGNDELALAELHRALGIVSRLGVEHPMARWVGCEGVRVVTVLM